VTADPATARTTPTVLTFERVGGAWTERAPALATPAEGDAFAFESAGQAIAISGNGQTVAIGNVTLYNGQGAALLFDYDGTTWQPRGEVRVPGASTFGSPSNVALDGDGDVLAVTDRSFSSFNGRVQIYTRSGNAWTQQAELVPSDGGASAAGVGEDFGLGLALRADGRALVATAPFNFDFPTTFRGRIYAFENTGGGTWVERENISLPAGEAEECLSVGLSADGATTLLGCSSVPDVPGGLFGVAVVLEDLAVDAEAEGPTPVTFGLGVAPNPVGAGQATSVRLDLDTASDVRIEVFDVLGRRVATLHDGPLSSGPQALALSTAAYPSGLYLVRATIEGEAAATRRLSVVQ
ncbi:MAG: T9SS type A sorting domain-containing protein, partial [Bacteroidota bacterium]